MINSDTLISVRIDPCSLAATAGMLLECCVDKTIGPEFSRQTVVQLEEQGITQEAITTASFNSLPFVNFQIPIGIVMTVAATLLTAATNKANASGAAWLTNACTPALTKIGNLLIEAKDTQMRDDHFDKFGNCMN